MKKHWLSLAIASFGLTLIFNPVAASADPEVFEASGATPADIQTAVDAFRNFLGPNNGVGGTFPTGRREINWDGVPDAFSAPNLMPANFFNSNSPRGAVFFTLGTGFQVSANSIKKCTLLGDLNTARLIIECPHLVRLVVQCLSELLFGRRISVPKAKGQTNP